MVRAMPLAIRWDSGAPCIVEESDHFLRNLSKTRVNRLRADLYEHVTHVLHQDQLCLITRGLEVPVELNRLRPKNFRVVVALNN